MRLSETFKKSLAACSVAAAPAPALALDEWLASIGLQDYATAIKEQGCELPDLISQPSWPPRSSDTRGSQTTT